MYVDTVSNPNNVWQIGAPQKPDFATAFTTPNVIITDTVYTYLINDLSSFVIVHQTDFGVSLGFNFQLGGFYSVDSDTLTDSGFIELSHDGGFTWLNVYENDYILDLNEFTSGLPVLSGNSNGWKPFTILLNGVYHDLGIVQQGQPAFDTLLFRYTFITDNIQTNKSGLMFDSLFVLDVPPIGIADFNELQIGIFPNPTNQSFEISSSENNTWSFTIHVYDSKGNKVKSFVSNSELTHFDV